MNRSTVVAVIVVAVIVFVVDISFAAPSLGLTRVVAVSGAAASDGNGAFKSFSIPSLNDQGEIAFRAMLVGTTGSTNDNFGVYRGNGIALSQIARTGQTWIASDTVLTFEFNDYLDGLPDPAISGLGQVTFRGFLGGLDDPLPDQALVRRDGLNYTTIARQGDTAPDGDGEFYAFYQFPLAINAGQIVFEGFLTRTQHEYGVFRSDGTSLTTVVRKGQVIPDGSDVFTNFDQPSLNNLGQVAMEADLTGGGYNHGIFLGDGMSVIQIARTGLVSPAGNGSLREVYNPTLNDLGHVAFSASLINTSGGTADNEAIYLGDGTSLIEIVRKGQALPSGNGTLGSFGALSGPTLNSKGQVAFHAHVVSSTSFDWGFFRADQATLAEIVRNGQASPNGNGTFSYFVVPEFNNAGQMAFLAELVGTQGGLKDNLGIFLYDDNLGLVQVAREGDSLLGSTIQSLRFGLNFGSIGGGYGGLNGRGEVGYWFTLADGRQGIAIWTIPEPASAVLVVGLMILGLFPPCFAKRGWRAPVTTQVAR